MTLSSRLIAARAWRMPMFVECPFCHRQVPKAQYAAHEKQHTTLLPDGQMADHITVREEERFKGSLGAVPQVYEHKRCGAQTGMPEEIIRSYLANPFLYNDSSFCTGCNDYVSTKELFWTETGESLFQYNQNLNRDHLIKQGVAPQNIRYAGDGRVLGKQTSGGAGKVLAVILILLLCLGLGGVAVIGGVVWMVAHSAPKRAQPVPVGPAPVVNLGPNRVRVQPDPLQDMHEHMRKQRESHQKMMDDMRRQHEETIRRMRER
jgi:hypothetical protein